MQERSRVLLSARKPWHVRGLSSGCFFAGRVLTVKTEKNTFEHVWLVYAGLALATLFGYGQVISFGFTNYDDPYIVWENPVVSSGLTLRGTYWALTTGFFDFWRPMTWLSHMLDCELFGLHGGMHHLMNLLYHIAATLLLFHALVIMTRAVWRSAIVAGLFALHPLHVESVAWIAERKDVLSGLFAFLTLACYARFATQKQADQSTDARVQAPRGATVPDQTRSARWYRASVVFFALGLMSKPVLVTLPFVLLLFDYWPLRRLQLATRQSAGTPKTKVWLHAWAQLVCEKWPFFILSVVSSAITYAVMKSGGNVLSGETVPWGLRLANVPISYVRYLGKTFVPVNLAPFYPMPDSWPVLYVVGSALILCVITVAALRLVRSAPYVTVGWLIFLGMLVPTIGIVQMGYHSIADRYTYLPLTGLFIAVVWGVADLAKKFRLMPACTFAVGIAILGVAGILTWRQVGHWRHDVSLWSWCIAVTKNNPSAHYGLGRAYHQLGQLDKAIEQYQAALQLDPGHLLANLNLGVVLARQGRLRDATNYFGNVLVREPKMVEAHLNMGNALFKLKDYAGATNHFARALELVPGLAEAHRTYAAALVELGDFNGTIAHADEAIRLEPRDVWPHVFKGRALSGLGRSDAALEEYFTALNLNYDCAEAHYRLGLEWLRRGKPVDAVASFNEALRISPNWAEVHLQLGMVLTAQGRLGEAIAHYREAVRVVPTDVVALNNLAWLLATAPDAQLRDGKEAVQLAERACALTGYAQTIFVGTLAAAYAEAGQFDNAVQTALRACDLAAAAGQTNLLLRNRQLLELFKAGQAYREGAPTQTK